MLTNVASIAFLAAAARKIVLALPASLVQPKYGSNVLDDLRLKLVLSQPSDVVQVIVDIFALIVEVVVSECLQLSLDLACVYFALMRTQISIMTISACRRSCGPCQRPLGVLRMTHVSRIWWQCAIPKRHWRKKYQITQHLLQINVMCATTKNSYKVHITKTEQNRLVFVGPSQEVF